MAVKPDIGLLGGSFDPVHKAHIALAHAARDALQLTGVQLLPAGRPWQRGQLGASASDRLHMLEIACAGQAGLSVNPVELRRPGATYTIDTLEALPDTARYTWILGTDQLANFCTWHRWRDILQHVRLAVALRPGSPMAPPEELAGILSPEGLVQIPFEPQPITATAIRTAIAEGRPADHMLDPAVRAYIREQGLYSNSSSTPTHAHSL